MGVQGSSAAMLPQLALIVDPDRAERQIYKTFLVPRGYVVDEASDGPEALAKGISDPPDIIITALRLPRSDGYQLCRLFRGDRETRYVPIVLITGDAMTPPRLHEQEDGCRPDAVLVKPFPPDVLLAQMRQLRDRAAQLRLEARLARSAAHERLAQSAHLLQQAARARRDHVKAD